ARSRIGLLGARSRGSMNWAEIRPFPVLSFPGSRVIPILRDVYMGACDVSTPLTQGSGNGSICPCRYEIDAACRPRCRPEGLSPATCRALQFGVDRSSWADRDDL